MKIAAFIIGSVFLLFSIQPILLQWSTAETACVTKSCCKKMQPNKGCDKKQPGKQDNGCNRCDPFMICPICCCYIVAENTYSASLIPGAKIVNKRPLHFFILSSYHPECWHPPELLKHLA